MLLFGNKTPRFWPGGSYLDLAVVIMITDRVVTMMMVAAYHN
jgi:hypothetical protein